MSRDTFKVPSQWTWRNICLFLRNKNTFWIESLVLWDPCFEVILAQYPTSNHQKFGSVGKTHWKLDAWKAKLPLFHISAAPSYPPLAICQPSRMRLRQYKRLEQQPCGSNGPSSTSPNGKGKSSTQKRRLGEYVASQEGPNWTLHVSLMNFWFEILSPSEKKKRHQVFNSTDQRFRSCSSMSFDFSFFGKKTDESCEVIHNLSYFLTLRSLNRPLCQLVECDHSSNCAQVHSQWPERAWKLEYVP